MSFKILKDKTPHLPRPTFFDLIADDEIEAVFSKMLGEPSVPEEVRAEMDALRDCADGLTAFDLIAGKPIDWSKLFDTITKGEP